MSLMIYVLGFSYYYLAILQRFEIPYSDYVNIGFLILQAIIWYRIFYNRSLASPYHLFFGGFLGLLFSMDTISDKTEIFSGAIENNLFHGKLFFEAARESKLEPILSFLTDLNDFSYYGIAALILFISYIFIGDMTRNTNQQDPNNGALCVCLSPFIMHGIWNQQSPMIILLFFIAIHLGLKHYLWKALVSGIITILHPMGLFFIVAGLWEKDKIKAGFSFLSSIILPAIYFVYLKDFIIIADIWPHFQSYVFAAAIGFFALFFFPINREFTNTRILPTSIFLMCLGSLGMGNIYDTPSLLLIATMAFCLSALSMEIWLLGLFSLLTSMFLFGTNLELIPHKKLTLSILFFSFLALICLRMLKEKMSQKRLHSQV